jgi:hypothetical protein
MKSMYRLMAVGILILLSNVAAADTYTYTGVLYTTATGTYTTAMSIAGSFNTASPLPANMASTEIGPSGSNLVTSWSFNDGLNTLDNTNSMELYGDAQFFTVATDATGQITLFRIGIMSPMAPHTVAQAMNAIFFSGDQQVTSAAPCSTVVSDVCTGIPGAGTNWGQSSTSGTWNAVPSEPPAPVAPVPTTSQWALILLSMLIGLMVFANRRRLF